MDILLHAVGIGIEASVLFVIYTFILWVLIKIQKLNYNVPGLLLVSGAAILVSFIPWVGAYAAYPILVFGLRRVTRADIAPDIVFTVAISRALMFCVNLFLLGALMGNLRPDLRASARPQKQTTEVRAEHIRDDNAPVAPKAAVSKGAPTVKGLNLKGIAINSSKALAIVSWGRNFHTVTTGECFLVQSPQATHKVSCHEITRGYVAFSVDGGDPVKLRLR